MDETRASAPLNRAVVGICLALAALALLFEIVLAPTQQDATARVAIRALLVYPGWLLLPGLPYLGWLLGRRRTPACPVLVVLGAVGLSAAAYAINLIVFKALAWTPHPLPYLGLGLAEAVPGLVLLWRGPPLTLQLPSRREIVAGAIAVVALLALGVHHTPRGTRPMDAYWYHARANEAAWEPSDVRLRAEGPWDEPLLLGSGEVRVYHPQGNDLTLVAEGSGPVTAVLLLRAEIGATLTLRRDGDVVGHAQVETHPVERDWEGPVLRYLDAGTFAIVQDLQVQRGDVLDVQIAARPGFALYDLTSSPPEAVWTLEEVGLHLVHYYQLLNIAENVEWARQLWTTRYVTLNQPPMWAYLHAGASLLGGPDLKAVYFVYLLVLMAIAAVGIRLVASLVPGAPVPALLLPVAGVLHHGHHVILHCEANFPDNMFALSITAACLALARADVALFGGIGLASTILRYPGSTVVTAAAVLHALLQRRPRSMLRPLMALWLPIAAFCVLMIVAGAVSGLLDHWFGILHFETFPEHWHGEYAAGSLAPRAPAFYLELLTYTGLLPLFALPLLGRGSRWLFLIAAGYSLLLCTIDHFTIHYHLPLMALLAAAAGCNTASAGQRFGAVAGWITSCVALAVSVGWLLWIL